MTATRVTNSSSFIEVVKDTSFTLARDDSGHTFLAIAPLTITLPSLGVLGDGFECRVVNDSGGSVILDGVGATNVTMGDGDIDRIFEVNSKQRVVEESTTIVGDLFTPGDPAWDPLVVLGQNLDLVRWWDATRNVTLDATSGEVAEWDDWIQAIAISQGKATQTDVTKQPASMNGEIRFEGQHKGLQLGTMGRAYFENRWLMLIFRVNWSALTPSVTPFLVSINGNSTTSAGSQLPQINVNTTTRAVSAVWQNSNLTLHTVTATVPAGDDTWHTLLTRRDEDAIYISIDGAPEVSLACYPRNFVPSAATRTGYIGNPIASGTVPSLSFGVSDLLMGQNHLTSSEVAKFHGWGMWRKGAEASLDASSPYISAAPLTDQSEVHLSTPDSYSEGYRFAATGGWDDTVKGNALSLSGFTRTFHDHFTSVSTITDGLSGTGPNWWAPAHIDTSSAHFRRPIETPTDTFTILPDNTTLQIKLTHVTTIYSGHIQSVDPWGNGNLFTCPTGGAMYFEASMSFNRIGGNATQGFVDPAPGWPAFWLYGNDRKDGAQSKCEVDIVEAYAVGNATTAKQMHQTLHLHGAFRPQPGNLGSPGNTGQVTHTSTKAPDMTLSPFNSAAPLFDGLGNGQPGIFHRYGCRIDETWITTYFDGIAVTRYPTFREALGPLYVIVSLQAQDVPGVTNVETYMWVDYVDVYLHS